MEHTVEFTDSRLRSDEVAIPALELRAYPYVRPWISCNAVSGPHPHENAMLEKVSSGKLCIQAFSIPTFVCDTPEYAKENPEKRARPAIPTKLACLLVYEVPQDIDVAVRARVRCENVVVRDDHDAFWVPNL